MTNKFLSFFKLRYCAFYLFSIFFVITFLFYYPAHNAMLIDDGISGLAEIKDKTFADFLRSYDSSTFYYGHYSFLILCYALFGLNSFPWFVVFVLFHAFNTVLLFLLCKKLFSSIESSLNSILIPLLSAVIFLISPYHSENIIWAATSHYAISFCILLLSMVWVYNYVTTNKPPFIILVFHLLFCVSLVTLEISFLYPLIFMLEFILLYLSTKNVTTFKSFVFAVLLPQILLLIIYFICFKLKTGNLSFDNRVEGISASSFPQLLICLSQHLLKLFGFVHFLNYKSADFIYSLCLHWRKALLLLTLIFLFISFIFFKKGKQKLYHAWFFIIVGITLYLPFLSRYFAYLFKIENDRYSYFASAFLLPFFVFLLFQLKPVIRYLIYSFYIVLFLYFLFPVIQARKQSALLYYTYLNKLKISNQGITYLLNVPTSCAHSYEFRATYRLPISYQMFFNKKIDSNLVQVAFYNSQTEKDSFEVKKLNDSCFQVQLKTNGSWWMHENLGAVNYENETYSFTLNEWGGYVIKFKQAINKENNILLFTGKEFIKVN